MELQELIRQGLESKSSVNKIIAACAMKLEKDLKLPLDDAVSWAKKLVERAQAGGKEA